ncbi:uncharacterized protein M421DRAFT_160376 [Didymella exigua CBS 183.55]|uniref:Uncharacterized protein n=1 Tax=Didymella exigua CBS 183.55 TaxID=1150837 RepID=A0A6A5RLR3_9PLEO|nr:uncharacterized protein M421DRAFT_160376 [Didymella exigua CBS 183.55]KAF1928403.1 hypothetical protein M421DRAFT_160376 [Didymella exigua CBS 183.55]
MLLIRGIRWSTSSIGYVNVSSSSTQRHLAHQISLQATDAHAGIGVNPTDGFLYFLDRTSAAKSAKWLWQRAPVANELPGLRSSSGIAFAFCNRVVSAATVTNLKYIMSCQIVNEHTEETIKRALASVSAGDIKAWPGTDFDFAFGVNKGEGIEAALAFLGTSSDVLQVLRLTLTGSPNGLAAEYFLIQHKQQLNWKHTWKIKVLESSDGLPYILFCVIDQAPWKGPVSNIASQLQKPHSKSCRNRSQGVASRKSKERKTRKSKERKTRKSKERKTRKSKERKTRKSKKVQGKHAPRPQVRLRVCDAVEIVVQEGCLQSALLDSRCLPLSLSDCLHFLDMQPHIY